MQDGKSHVFAALKSLARDARISVLGTCAGEVLPSAATPETLQATLQAGSTSGKTAIVVVCSDNSIVAAQLLEDMTSVVTGYSDKHLVLHTVAAGVGEEGTAQQKRRRSLLQSNGTSDYETCDSECQKDVKKLEVFIVLVVLAMALTVMFFCMHCIDTPTKFSGGAATRHQHQE